MNLPNLRRWLLRWFSRSKRALPWRATRDPYPIWVSEMMLQQTTVAAVIPYFERFMARFPNISALAAAEEDEVLALWSGLGYYSRARNLRRAALQLVLSHAGSFPKDVETAMTLPGVGKYTASAVTSMAYGTRAAVVDGNVRRVLARLHAVQHSAETKTQAMADTLLSQHSPGTWNEAMMELGATICTPRKPKCPDCPIASHCAGKNQAEHWSEGKPRRKGLSTNLEMVLVEKKGQVFLTRNPPATLMAGLYELPHTGVPRARTKATSLQQRYRGILSVDSKPVATFRHSVTHHRIQASVFKARLLGKHAMEGGAFYRIHETANLPLGGLTRKALKAAQLT